MRSLRTTPWASNLVTEKLGMPWMTMGIGLGGGISVLEVATTPARAEVTRPARAMMPERIIVMVSVLMMALFAELVVNEVWPTGLCDFVSSRLVGGKVERRE